MKLHTCRHMIPITTGYDSIRSNETMDVSNTSQLEFASFAIQMLKSFSPAGFRKQPWKTETFWSSNVNGHDSHARTPELEGPYQSATIKGLAELQVRTFSRRPWPRKLDQQTLAPLAAKGLRWQPYWSKSFGNLSKHLGESIGFTRPSRILRKPRDAQEDCLVA